MSGDARLLFRPINDGASGGLAPENFLSTVRKASRRRKQIENHRHAQVPLQAVEEITNQPQRRETHPSQKPLSVRVEDRGLVAQRESPRIAPIPRPPDTAQRTSTANQRQPHCPISSTPNKPRPSITNGNAVPSLRPASQVRLNRSRSRSAALSSCTSEASTGSVGARIAPKSTPAPKGIPRSQTPKRVISPTVKVIETNARRIGTSHLLSRNAQRNFSPAVKSETMTAGSANRSSHVALPSGSKRATLKTNGPIRTPPPR